MKLICIIFILCTTMHTVRTQEKKADILFEIANYKFPYNLQKAENTYQLPGKLLEISGLSFYKKNVLAAVQDEKGNIYLFNLKTGKLSEKIDFAQDGDYEGIEVVENQIWILKSNGNLYRVKYSKKDNKIKTKEYKTDLSAKNDTEGLAYDKKNNRLLIACKGHPYIDDKKGKNKKAIYSFDLNEKEISKNPIIIINLKQIKELKQYNTMARLGIDFLSFIDSSKGDVSFQPSGIAVHPKTENIYLLGTVGKLLIVCNNIGEILSIVELNSGLFIQPEGICFDQTGNLFISNEGREAVATILKFKPRQQ